MEGRARIIVCFFRSGLLWVSPPVPRAFAAPPPIAMRTQAHALGQSGSPLPIGTPIHTFLDGVDYSNGSRVQDTVGSFAVLTAGNSKTNSNASDTPSVQEGANLGDPLIYASGDFTAATRVFQESFTWSPGSVTLRDLHLGAPSSTPQPVKIEGVVGLPARGGNQFAFVCNPATSPVSLADYYLERDAPGTYHGGTLDLTGVLAATSSLRVDLSSPSWLTSTGDALKLVYRNPSGGAATAGGRDIVVDRVEFNATRDGTLYWEPGNTIFGDAPAPGPGQILERDAACTDTNDPRDITATDLVFRVDVQDPFGAHASASQTFSLTRQSPIALIAAILIAVVLLVFVIFGFRRARKHEQAPSFPPARPPTAPASPPPIAPPIGAVLAGGDKKICPRCHTAVKAADVTCFFCGFKFAEENTTPP